MSLGKEPPKLRERREGRPMGADADGGHPNIRSLTHNEPVIHLTLQTDHKLAVLGRHIMAVTELASNESCVTLTTGQYFIVRES